MEPHKHETTRRFESELFPGVSVILRKMTEGRRIELRRLINEDNRRIRDILREQADIEKQPDESRNMARWLDLQDEFNGLLIEKVNPIWIKWGVKQVEGLEVDGRALGAEDWENWPSALFTEVIDAVKAEAELNGIERKNLSSPTTFGAQGALSQKPSTAEAADEKVGGATGTVGSTSQVN